MDRDALLAMTGRNDICLRRLAYFHEVITHFLVTVRRAKTDAAVYSLEV